MNSVGSNVCITIKRKSIPCAITLVIDRQSFIDEEQTEADIQNGKNQQTNTPETDGEKPSSIMNKCVCRVHYAVTISAPKMIKKSLYA